MKPIKQLPSQETLKQMFFYENGLLFHKTNKGKARVNKPVGWKEKNGYWSTNVHGIRYRLHRLVYQFHHDNCPEFLDHIDNNRDNNTIENLRPATSTQNGANRRPSRKNKIGLKGVCFDNNRYKANIKVKGKSYHLGYFDTPEEAYSAYCKKAKEVFGDYAWTGNSLSL